MWIVLVVLAVAGGMMMVELRRPGRAFPAVAGWWSRAALLNGMQVGVVWLAGSSWDGWMLGSRLWTWSGSDLAGSLVGYLAITFVYYGWHRWRHASTLLWRGLHQVHHSVGRIEVLASFYKHPLEVLANGLLSSAILFWGVGLSVEQALPATLLTGLAELFYHWNVQTPHWVGYLFQRPEMHCVHHEKGHHRFNYGDLPLWDLLFGTFHNPRTFEGEVGFGAEQERELGALLAFQDVAGAAARGGQR